MTTLRPHRPPSLRDLPGHVRVVPGDRGGYFPGVGAQVLLQDLAVVAALERHDAGAPVVSGPGDEREAGDHVAVDHVVVSAAGRIGALLRENAEVVAAEWFALLAAFKVLLGRGGEGAERTLDAVGSGRPVEAVLSALAAPEPLGEREHAVAVVVGAGVLALRIDIRLAELDRRQFVAADAAIGDLLDPGLDVEGPACFALDQRDRHRPAAPAHDDGHPTLAIRLERHP